jgi:ligand-binding sensor domain-containing protein
MAQTWQENHSTATPAVTSSNFDAMLPRALRMARGILALVLMFGMGTAAMLGLNPERAIDQYDHNVWMSQHGLPGQAVYQILQTPDGYLWMRTSSGLARFDGVQFASMDEQLSGEPVRAICTSVDGNLLIRTTSHTILYKNGEFTDYLPPAPLPDGGIRSLFSVREHEVFIGSDDFLYLAKNDGIHLLKSGTAWVSSFLEDIKGTVWIGGTKDLFTYRDGTLASARQLSPYGGVSAFAEDSQNNFWVGTGTGLYRVTGNGAVFQPAAVNETRGGVHAILEDRRKNLWVATESGGLVRFRDGQASRFMFTDGLTDNKVLSLFEDREGSLWVGTASGLDRFRDTKITTYTAQDGLPTSDTK